MNVLETKVELMDGKTVAIGELAHGPILVVNVASKCGLTPQYTALEELQKKYQSKGFTVVGVPTNQFMQEPGSEEAIQSFCSTTYGVTFPLTKKTRVNGRNRHDLYKELVKAKDGSGMAGPIMWNFEKFLVLPSGEVLRFRPTTKPDDAAIVGAIEANLKG
ncbi:MAG: hypothetical protein RIS80_784 [Actinomycetota bacterium]|jgi:glutathione peroxidase